MFALGQEEVKSTEELVEHKAGIMQSAAEMRDRMFDENQQMAIKSIGGVVIALYIAYRYLMGGR